MKKILLILTITLTIGITYAQDDKSPATFDKNKFEKILPSGWYIETIKENSHPYGFLEDKNNNGLNIFLKGSTDVKDKGQLTTKESISIWIMPLSYSANKVPFPGTPHFPAKLIGVNQNSQIFVLPWNDTPSWKSWEKDLTLFFEMYPRSGVLGYSLKTELTIEWIKLSDDLSKKNPPRFLLISIVNGKKIQPAKHLQIRNVDTDSVKAGTRFILKGYESGKWGGCDVCQMPKQFFHDFVVTEIESPESLKIETSNK